MKTADPKVTVKVEPSKEIKKPEPLKSVKITDSVFYDKSKVINEKK